MKTRLRYRLALAIFLFSVSLSSAQTLAQEKPEPKTPSRVEKKSATTIRVDVPLVLVPVTIVDPEGRAVTGLERAHFRVFDEKVEQEIVTFSSEDAPVSIGIIFDLSGSMANKVDKARQAAIQFLKTANPPDEFFLVTFNDRARVLSPFTSDITELQTKLGFIKAEQRTALIDAIYLGLTEMRNAHNAKKALLIISDGGDNHSRYNESDVKNFVKEADVQLYAIGIFDPFGYRKRTPEELHGPELLTELAEMTGGRLFPVENLNNLPDTAIKISMELRSEYVLGYRPSSKTRDGKYRKIQVKLRPPKGLPPLSVYARNGYYAR